MPGTVPGATTARPQVAQPDPRRTVLAATLGALGFGLLTTLVGASSGAPLDFLVLDATIGGVYLAAGVMAWLRRPEVLTGPLLVACSVFNFVGSYGPTNLPALSHLGFAFQGYYDLALAVLVLALPGRWPAGLRRGVSLTLLALFLARTASRLVLTDPAALGCGTCPPNPFALVSDPSAFTAIETATNAAIALLTLAIAVDCIGRLIRSRPVTRRVMWPILAAGAVAMSVAAFDAAEFAYTTATGLPLVEVPDEWQTAVSWALYFLRLAVPVGLLLGTVRLRRAGGPLVALAVGLGEVPSPVRLESALAAALGDPDVRLVRPDADRGWIGSDGTAVAAPVEDEHHAVTTLEHDGRLLAAIIHDPVLREDPALVGAVIAVLRLAVENERLDSELRDRLEEVRASRARLVVAAEEERRRVERDLHDGAQQRLVAVTLALQQARQTATETGAAAEVRDGLGAVAEELQGAIDDLRELARGIHPALLEAEGLPAAIVALGRRAGVPVDVEVDLERRLPAHLESTVYFLASEAVTNAVRHARASRVTIAIRDTGERLEVAIRDDGIGGADPQRGSGLRGLADRLAAVDGSLDVESPVGGGTTIRARVPLP